MTLISGNEKEQKVVDEISADELMKHTAYIAEEDRLSGSEGEARAVEYFKDVMTGLGFEVDIKQVENFFSLPLSAAATVISPESKDLPCITQSFSAATPPRKELKPNWFMFPKAAIRMSKIKSLCVKDWQPRFRPGRRSRKGPPGRSGSTPAICPATCALPRSGGIPRRTPPTGYLEHPPYPWPENTENTSSNCAPPDR